jgi:hypothetical protein
LAPLLRAEAADPSDRDRTQIRKTTELIRPGFENPLTKYFHWVLHSPWFHAMPLYFLRIQDGRYTGESEHGIELPDRDAAWEELTAVCGDMVSGISRKFGENAQWQMELLDESRKPVFRIRLVAESLD